VEDHVHLLVGLRATHSIADCLRELKKAGTAWVRKNTLEASFAWQEGYAEFTVSPTARGSVKAYIQNQVEHHRRWDLLEELKWLLEKGGNRV
jgi:REP element-mobilizing transposase RayT